MLTSGRHKKELCGGDAGTTTNNRMELTAPIEALKSLKWRCDVHIYTDSKYVFDGATKSLSTWKSNGWRTQSKAPVKNVDLWKQLDAAMLQHEVNWHWVKGHAGHQGNERADQLAVKGMQDAVAAANNAPPIAVPRSAATPAFPRADSANDGECVHQLPTDWCALCKPPAAVLPRGYRTTGGSAYHNDPDCEWLVKGQQRAGKQGKRVHQKIQIDWASVNPDELEPCEFCCSQQWLDRRGY